MEPSRSRGQTACTHLSCFAYKSFEGLPGQTPGLWALGEVPAQKVGTDPVLSPQSRQSQQDPFGQCQPRVTAESPQGEPDSRLLEESCAQLTSSPRCPGAGFCSLSLLREAEALQTSPLAGGLEDPSL